MGTTASRFKAASIWGLLAAVAMAMVLATTLGVGIAQAKSNISFPNNSTSTTVKQLYVPGKGHEDSNHITLNTSKDTDIEIVSYDKKMVKPSVYINEYWGDKCLDIQMKKAGTSKVVFKMHNTKYTVKINAIKFTFPLKTLTIDGVDYKTQLQKEQSQNNSYSTGVEASEQLEGKTVVAKANKGWKLTLDYGNLKSGQAMTSNYLHIEAVHPKTEYKLLFNVVS